MNERERRVRDLLKQAPEDRAAEERAWRVVSRAFDERRLRPAPRGGMHRRLAVAVALVLALGLVALSPAGAAVADWIGNAFDPGRKDAAPALSALPSPGRVLVTSDDGPWVVQANGSKRRLGPYRDAAWSPQGLFVIVTSGRQLIAVEPDGDPRWSLARGARVSNPAWSPDGFRVAYLSGDSLRVVAGDGTGDRLVAQRAAPAAPAWRPGAPHVLAYVDDRGRITAIQTDSRRRLWRSPPGPVPARLAWTPDGRTLVAMAAGEVRLLDSRGRLLRRIAGPAGARNDAISIHPSGQTAALARHDESARRGEVVALRLAGAGPARRLFAGDGRFSDLAWSPDGRWLLIGWADADQWLFVRSAGVPRITAVSNISRQFDPADPRRGSFPRVSGWCCAR